MAPNATISDGELIMSYSSSIPTAVLRAYPELAAHPTIAEVFRPGQGWRTLRGNTAEIDRYVAGGYRKRITASYARKLHRDGVTAVALDLGNGRRADFTTTELTR